MSQGIRIALIGAGSRGLRAYGDYLVRNPEHASIVAVADPQEDARKEAQRIHKIDRNACFSDWRELITHGKLADAVIIATPDSEHVGPAVAFAKQGYHILLEKPMANTEADCRQIIEAVRSTGVMLSVCHVLRYTPYFRKIRELVRGGILGQISSVRHVEHVGYWHFAHSYVRGNWRNAASSSPTILAKACHDMDILLYLLGKHCREVGSFGRLSYFLPKNKPTGATSRCVTCKFSLVGCHYSAVKFYGDRLKSGNHGWPVRVVTNDMTEEGLERALTDGPYGRCVYDCDNDVVDQQDVILKFDDDISAVFTLNAFHDDCYRETEIFGSHGRIWGNSKYIETVHFLTGETARYEMTESDGSAGGGHLGGDDGIMFNFLEAIRLRDSRHITTSPDESLESHLMAFAAERARITNRIEKIQIL